MTTINTANQQQLHTRQLTTINTRYLKIQHVENTRKHIASHKKTKQSMQFKEVILFQFSESLKNTNTSSKQNSQIMDAKACGTCTRISHHALERLILCLDFHLEKSEGS